MSFLASFEEFEDLFSVSNDERTALKKNRIDVPDICPMDSYDKKRASFRDALSSLASLKYSLDENEAKSLSNFFVKLYFDMHEDFRHMYSDVYVVIKKYLKSGGKLDEDIPFEAVNLSNNIGLIEKELIAAGSCADVIRNVRKLHDHIELENKRIEYMATQNKVQHGSIKKVKRQFEENLTRKVNDAERAFKQKVETDIEEAQQKLQRNYITILGIFAAIVVAFMSGTAFSSSVLENIDKASIYRISFIVLIVGFFMFNLVCALFIFLNKVSDIENGAMRRLLCWVDVVFVMLVILVVTARSIDILAMFPINILAC